jgi:hypothetical protein
MRIASSFLVSALALVVACSSSSSGSSSVSADQACTDFANAACSQLNSCYSTVFQTVFPDVMTCQAREKLACTPVLNAQGTSATPGQVESCAQALQGGDCSTILGFVQNAPPSACQTQPGSLADGTACGEDGQCKNMYCRKATGQICGVCSSKSAAGSMCVTDKDCQYTLVCGGGNCLTPGAAGSTCDVSRPCASTFSCKSGTCAIPSKLGDNCTPTLTPANDTCDRLHGQYCDVTGVCKAFQVAGAGASCGVVNNDYAVCGASGTCNIMPPGLTGTCKGTAADGATCNATGGPDCAPPATCVNGACKLDDPSTCH